MTDMSEVCADCGATTAQKLILPLLRQPPKTDGAPQREDLDYYCEADFWKHAHDPVETRRANEAEG